MLCTTHKRKDGPLTQEFLKRLQSFLCGLIMLPSRKAAQQEDVICDGDGIVVAVVNQRGVLGPVSVLGEQLIKLAVQNAVQGSDLGVKAHSRQ